MRVTVDESRENQLAARVDLLLDDHSFWGKVETGAGTRTNGDNRISTHGQETVLEDATTRVHRDDRAAGDQQVHGHRFLGWRLRPHGRDQADSNRTEKHARRNLLKFHAKSFHFGFPLLIGWKNRRV